MMDQIPTFAVVGRPNKGKSSIVATLAENDRVAISPTPGTTRVAQRHVFCIDSEPRYALVDTPGFQRPRELLTWLQKRADSASDRPSVVADFVRLHEADPRFLDECELLRPLVEGAGILYVVDGAKPYGAEYELEMEILQWTGRPRMALINLIGEGDYLEQWRQALGQYFSIVRVFDAIHADFEKRVSLLRAFGELNEAWRAPLETAVKELAAERSRRQTRSAREIADNLVMAMTRSERVRMTDSDDVSPIKVQLRERLQERIRQREQSAMKRVQAIYLHGDLDREVKGMELLATDLFTNESWELFGLAKSQLAVTGALSGAAVGGGIDLMLGGASLLLGAGIGALLGGAGAWFGGEELASFKVMGNAVGGRVLQVGPVEAKNFPWVLLGRAWLHHRLVAERNHAWRAALVVAVSAEQNLMDAVPGSLRTEIAVAIRRVAKGDAAGDSYDRLVAVIDKLLEHDPRSKIANGV